MTKKISEDLEGVISQMLKPLKGLSLNVVIEGLSGYKIIPFDRNCKKDEILLTYLCEAAIKTITLVNKKGILKPRANEVGNDIEPYVKKALNDVGYKAETSETITGKKKSMGYPDIIFWDNDNRINYLECKTFNIKNIDTTQRSFYISPSKNFKITENAHHFAICFEVCVAGNKDNNHIYKCNSWKILDLTKLKIDIKYEFNSNNKRMYEKKLILAEGT
jgi:hypothetical protein